MFDQMVRNEPGGEMRNYWRQDPLPAEEFIIERFGSQVINALEMIRDPARSNKYDFNVEDAELTGNYIENDALKIGQFRLSGEVHQWMYDSYSLGRLLMKAGFQEIRQCQANESSIKDFITYFLDLELNGSVRKPDSLFVEARK
jgi:hypothetical protein